MFLESVQHIGQLIVFNRALEISCLALPLTQCQGGKTSAIILEKQLLLPSIWDEIQSGPFQNTHQSK